MKSFKQDIKSGLVRWVVFLATILAGWIIYAAIGSTWTSPATLEVWAGSGLTATSWNKLLENFNNLDSRVNTLNTTITNLPAVPQFLWQAEQNVDLIANDATWRDISWASVTFNLANSKKIWTTAHWIVMTDWTNTAWYSHTYCSFRFNIDWVSYWDPTRWNQIIWCWGEASWYWNRCNWNMEKVMDLAAWNHTVKIQMRGYWTSYYSCRSVIYDYWRARLFVETKN
ncbi:MAG: hypothetical protein ACD_49C00026G0008 [uncultured bacterium (gcode 4)]|uniref:Uncharacterized protein n=1 Tax=uncultured bacterium (gcode 4) TaxID=1234023 RepID=K2BD32_9BACT|nr:MAG: hypothetical protein ACD_49C00026G0008 [uncultured bacterium (gcode 4)]